jgi:hypothetical protein
MDNANTTRWISIKLRDHLLILSLLMILALFFIQIFSFFFLWGVEIRVQDVDSSHKKLYRYGEYAPISAEEAPKVYKFVIVTKRGDSTEEVYYTPRAERIKVLYFGNRWRMTSSLPYSLLAFLIWPVAGMFLIGYSILRQAARAREFLTWRLARSSLERGEKILLLYGISLFIIGIVLGAVHSR